MPEKRSLSSHRMYDGEYRVGKSRSQSMFVTSSSSSSTSSMDEDAVDKVLADDRSIPIERRDLPILGLDCAADDVDFELTDTCSVTPAKRSHVDEKEDELARKEWRRRGEKKVLPQ